MHENVVNVGSNESKGQSVGKNRSFETVDSGKLAE